MPTSKLRPMLQTSAAIVLTLVVTSPAFGQVEEPAIEESGSDIVVTATRREASVQDIPLAVTAISGEAVEKLRMTTIADVARQAPNVLVTAPTPAHTPRIFIRGLGLTDFNPNAVGAVGVYQDEIYINSTSAQLSQMFDVARVEILRGPQGTLYGRNTTGGVINLISNRPKSELGFEGKVGYGRFDALDLQGIANVPLSDTVSTRVAVQHRQRDAIFENTNGTGDTDDMNVTSARAQLLFEPANGQSWLLSMYGSKLDGKGNSYDRSVVALHPLHVDPGKPRSEALTDAGYTHVSSFGTTLTGKMELGGVDLTTVTGYLKSSRDIRNDIDMTSAPEITDYRDNHANQFSQEFRLSSQGESRFQWTLGGYYFYESLDARVHLDAIRFGGSTAPSATFQSRTIYTQYTTSLAGFFDGTYKLSDSLEFFGGLRLSYEKKDFRSQQAGFFNAPQTQFAQADSWTDPTGQAGLRWSMNSDMNVYAKYARGFRGGGFNAGGGVSDPPFDPEYVDSFELGYKSAWMNNALRFNVAAFYNKYRDMQVFTVIPGDIPVQVLTNAAESSIKGVEAELFWRPTSNFDLQLGGGWLDAKIDDYKQQINATTVIDRSGNKLQYAPEWTFSGNAGYRIPLGGGAEVEIRGDAAYRSSFFFDIANTKRLQSDAYWLFGARMEFRSEDSRYGLALWGRNLSDTKYLEHARNVVPAYDGLKLGEPRTYGVEVSAKF